MLHELDRPAELNGNLEKSEMQLMRWWALPRAKPIAFELANGHVPDLALVDLHPARQTRGAGAAAFMRADFGIPSTTVSGSLHELTAADIAAIALVALLGKPFSPMKLHAAIREADDGRDQLARATK